MPDQPEKDHFDINFTILRNGVEIGFGAAIAARSVDAAAYEVESIVQNRIWETSGDMPDPDEVDR